MFFVRCLKSGVWSETAPDHRPVVVFWPTGGETHGSVRCWTKAACLVYHLVSLVLLISLPGVIASLRVHGKRITPPPPPSVSSANNYKINTNMSWKYAIHTKLYNPSNVLTITSTYKANRRTNRTKKEPTRTLKKKKRRAVNVALRLKIFFLIDTDGVVPSWRHTPRVKFSFLSLATFFSLPSQSWHQKARSRPDVASGRKWVNYLYFTAMLANSLK